MQRAINNGVRWLDGYFGREGWVGVIDTKKLSLASGTTCVIGQMFQQEHQTLCDNFSAVIASGKMSREQATRRGFFLPSSAKYPWRPDNTYYTELTHLWIEKIGALRRAELGSHITVAEDKPQPGAVKSPIQVRRVLAE